MTDEKPKKSRWLLWVTIGCFFLMLLSPVALYRVSNRAVFNRRVEQLAADGFPISVDDLQAVYVLPEGQPNAADLYLKAFAAYVEPNEIERERLPIRGNYVPAENEPPYPDDILMVIKGSLDKNQKCLALLDQASHIDACLLLRTGEPFSLRNEYYQILRKTGMLLAERNVYLAQTGQSDALFESILTSAGLSKALSMEPQLIDHLIMVSMQSVSVESMEQSLNLTAFSQDQLAALQQEYHRMFRGNTFQKGLIAERVEFISTMDMPAGELIAAYDFSSLREKAWFVLYVLTGLKDRDSVLVLDFSEKQIAIAALPYHEQIAAANALDAHYAYPDYHILLQFLPRGASLFRITMRAMGRVYCTETALAIERYRLTYQSLPASLESLVPEFMETVYLDPFDGKPLRYVLRDTGGYTVYCIGEDGIDNGGIDEQQMRDKTGSKNPKEFDYTFTVKH